MTERGALLLDPKDNVAVVLSDLEEGALVRIQGQREPLRAVGHVPFGHKLALRGIAPGQPIIKYGQTIGIATRAIAEGEHVHIHNIESRRGRGDLEAR